MKVLKKTALIIAITSSLSACNSDTEKSIDSESTKTVSDSSTMTQGANKLSENNTDNVWRFAVIPDTQGRDDDDYKQTITHSYDGITLSIDIGYDVNNDNIFDGEGWKIDVSDPYNAIFVNEDGEPLVDGEPPVEIASRERFDTPYDFKHLPALLVDPIVSKIKAEGVSIVLAVGDMTDVRTENEYIEWMVKVANPLTEAGMTVLPVRGNHEIVDGYDWLSWFTTEVDTTDSRSVNNMDNGIDAYTDADSKEYDQGYNLYQKYPGTLLTSGLESGEIVGYEEIEDLMYYTVQNNTLFIAVDFYASDLVSVSYEGTWLLIYDWLKNVLETKGSTVDHIVMFGHEALSTKKRPSVYNYDEYFDYISSLSTGEENEDQTEPGILGLDTGQLGYLQLQDESSPGLMDNVLNLLSEYKVNYIAGHDHQYSRSLIHPDNSNPSVGFTQIVAGNASWKAYNNRYGINDKYETGLSQDNFAQVGDYEGSNSQYTKDLTKYEKSNKISFVIVEVNGRQITFKNYYAPVNFSEADMNMGTYWDENQNAWVQYDIDSTGTTFESIIPIEWSLGDSASYTNDALQRVVSPYESYWTTTKTPDEEGYIGTEAAILDGFNLTYNSVEVLTTDTQDKKQVGIDANYQDDLGTGKGEYTSFADAYNIPRQEQAMDELLSLSWFTDDDIRSVSDILYINGNLNQDGSYKNTNGFVQTTSPSELYFDKDAVETDNPTNVVRDGIVTDEDEADAMTIAITAPKSVELSTLTIGRYNQALGIWETFLDEECFTATSYSDDFSVMFKSGAGSVPSDVKSDCGTYLWGYNYNNHSVWGFTHKDGLFALITKVDNEE
ncbi:metallophosphoesterase family protein [uncultured Psychromonas sp.]|uniref:metallophosphoesterase family protein n=1 Tax=uncultured Psychromonas sp. TaxID=173974 RepID=UPI00263A11DD|nr:metallophosphoesterase family protein [uncultured Psychromonas sp.]